MSKDKPITFVILGVTGDLYQNKLASSLFSLFQKDFLPKDFQVLGFARRPLNDVLFRDFTREVLVKKGASKEKLDDFLGHFFYLQGNFDEEQSFLDLGQTLGEMDLGLGRCSSKLFYLAVPPDLYNNIFENIYKAGLSVPCAKNFEEDASHWTRILVEKPFGHDLKTAKQLDETLAKYFIDSQVFRIDHYLEKKAVQSILDFRFKNGIFEPLWNNQKISKIRLVVHEPNDLSKRGDFYDNLGALKDVGQNHMLQMLALVAMDKPVELSSTVIHQARENILANTHLKKVLVRGQYEGYVNEPGVNKDSKTETFFRVMLSVDTPRWEGVDFEIESGKALSKYDVYVDVYFTDSNARLTFSISSFVGESEAYEEVFKDSILGDMTRFVGNREIIFQWKIIEEIINDFYNSSLVIYKKGVRAKEIK